MGRFHEATFLNSPVIPSSTMSRTKAILFGMALGVLANSCEVREFGGSRFGASLTTQSTVEAAQEAKLFQESHATYSRDSEVGLNLFGLRTPGVYLRTITFPDGKTATGIVQRDNSVKTLAGQYVLKKGPFDIAYYAKN
jgi:hypothetical protein